MELKNFQRRVLQDLADYLRCLNEPAYGLEKAFSAFWASKGVQAGFGAVKPYKNTLPGTPHVCFKVPTGGGKTYLASCSIKPIAEAVCTDRPRVVVWLVPSNAILDQTVNNLQNMEHPYRQRLEIDFGGRLAVVTKDQLLYGQNFSPTSVREQVTVCVLSYDSLRAARKDGRLVYRENSALEAFAQLEGGVPVEGADETALIQALNLLSPIVIVDESHNAQSDLSVEMLKNLNPSFVLDLTATPKSNSNIISFVDARALKNEDMVKLPVIVFNRNNQEDVLLDALSLRNNLEKAALAEQETSGRYIRPIILFQAEPKGREDAQTFSKVKEGLRAAGIPEEQIAIKTSQIDELKGENLEDPGCPIRYIITVNALKEGWDCPFAYVLATLANKTSRVDVEQILGRVLRLPQTKQNNHRMLNMSYVITSSNDFKRTVESVVKGLNQAGFTRRDCVIEEAIQQPGEQKIEPVSAWPIHTSEGETENDGLDIGYIIENRQSGTYRSKEAESFEAMAAVANQQGQAYEDSLKEATDLPLAQEVVEQMPHFSVQGKFMDEAGSLVLPQFHRHVEESLFREGSLIMLSKESLTGDFRLSEQDAHVDFTSDASMVVEVDIQKEGDSIPKHRLLSVQDSKIFREAVESTPREKRIDTCAYQIYQLLDKDDTLNSSDLKAYIQRVVHNMKREELDALEHSVPTFARKIKQKIESLQAVHRHKRFMEGLETREIVCPPGYGYRFPEVIAPIQYTNSMVKTLYEAEANDMNNFEYAAISRIAALDNVRWWHRVIERRGFCLNGAINHYPDFIVCTEKGTIILVETKGDHLINEETKQKLALGRAWKHQLGEKYQYFMVFQSAEVPLEGAHTLDKALQIIERL